MTGSECWVCGKSTTRRYFVTERLLDYGHYEGRTQRSPLHKECYDKVPEYHSYFIHGLEDTQEGTEFIKTEDRIAWEELNQRARPGETPRREVSIK